MKTRNMLYAIPAVPVLLILVWLFAVPLNLIQERIEDAVTASGGGNMSLTISGFRKGVLFTLYADSLMLLIDSNPAMEISHFTSSLSPARLFKREIAFNIKGKIAEGDLYGIVKLPLEGKIHIDRAGLDEIPYLARLGTDIHGNMTAEIELQNQDITAVFHIPDLSVQDSGITVIPLLNTFRKMQGALSLSGNDITVESVSLEGEKGYARLKGKITGNYMNLSLELMPVVTELTALESMLIGKYIVSPGYYVVPVRGRLP